jgi:hypothetical protein
MRCGAFLLLALSVGPTAAQDVVLTRAEAQVLKSIVSRDRFLQQLSGALPGLDALNGLQWREIDGPVGMALTWDQAAIADWRRANAALAKVGLHGICDDIQLQIVANSTNRALFEQLSAARACGD